MNYNEIMEEQKKRNTSPVKLIFKMLFMIIILIILLLLAGTWLVMHPSKAIVVQSSQGSFIPSGNQILIPETDIVSLITDLVPENEWLGIEQTIIDSGLNSLHLYSRFTIFSNVIPLINKEIQSSLDVVVECVPQGELYRIELKKLKIGKLPIFTKWFNRKLLSLYKPGNSSLSVENSAFLLDVNSLLEKETGAGLVQAVYFREEGILLSISSGVLNNLGLGTEQVNTLLKGFNLYSANHQMAETSNEIDQILDRAASLTAEDVQIEKYAQISYLEGDVQIGRDEDTWFAGFGENILSGDMVDVQKNSFCEIILPDGSMLKLSENSLFSFEELDFGLNTRRVQTELTQGELAAKIAKLTRDDSLFEIKSSGTVMGIRGTSFVINNQKGSVLLEVLEGLVAMSDGKNEEMVESLMYCQSENGKIDPSEEMEKSAIINLEESMEFTTSEELREGYLSEENMMLYSQLWSLYMEYTELDEADQNNFETYLENFIQDNPAYLKELEKTGLFLES